MAHTTLRRSSAPLWELARKQHGVVSRRQLLSLGLSPNAIKHRVAKGRLHPLWRGVYAVGRREVSRHGLWMAATLACGDTALLSHRSAAGLWGLLPAGQLLEVTVPSECFRRRPGIRVHRRVRLGSENRRRIEGIPVTDLASTLVDLAACARPTQVERAINEADRLDLIDPESLRAAVEPLPRRPGLSSLKALLDRCTFTDSGLERRFLSLARAAGFSDPETQAWVNGSRVDFFWPALGLVVETDGLRYHRTPLQQANDRRRDQSHVAAGLTVLRFAEAQIRFEPARVQATLAEVVHRLHRSRGGLGAEAGSG